jgi:outer membrane protein TolC
VRPDTPRTAAYKESPPEAYKNPGVWQPAQPSDDTLRANWWELFGDEQLNALEQQVVLGNQDLKVAEARFREARALIGYARASEFPTIGVGSGIRSLRDSSTQPYFPLPSSHATGDFVLPADLSYEVDLWGRIRRSVVAAGKEAQATAADLESIKLSPCLRIPWTHTATHCSWRAIASTAVCLLNLTSLKLRPNWTRRACRLPISRCGARNTNTRLPF